MYVLTKLGQATIGNVEHPKLDCPHNRNFKVIWKEFENGNRQLIVNNQVIKKLDTIGVTRNTFDNGVRVFSLAQEYFEWKKDN